MVHAVLTLIQRSLWIVLSLALFSTSGLAGDNAPGNVDETLPLLPRGVEFLEAVAPEPGTFAIGYRKYRLLNGLTVILHEDKSDPLVHVDVSYHVGSGREEMGKSGFAHFFEHMMFQGSEHVGDEQHFKIVAEAGGTLNGSTNMDRSNYYQTIPSNQLEKILWLEADRMGFLLPAVTQKKFEVQRETVKSERGQRVDNKPYGLLKERIGEALYPQGHPYSWPVLGYLEDLDGADVNDLKNFFLRWYGPNNATLTIGGDFDSKEVLSWVAKYFAPISRGPEVTMPLKSPAKLEKSRYISMQDNVALPMLHISYPTVFARHEDEAALGVLMSVIGQGKTSLLYKKLIKTGYATEAGAVHDCRELSCSFAIKILANPGAKGNKAKSLAELETILQDSFREFEAQGVEDDDLMQVKAGIVSSVIYALGSVRGRVSQLAYHEIFTQNPNYLSRDIAHFEQVSKEDVMRVYRNYIKDKPALVMSIVPTGEKNSIARTDTWHRQDRRPPSRIPIEEKDLAYRVVKDSFDRGSMPAAQAAPDISLPVIWRDSLANEVKILGAVNTETPTTTLNLVISAGQKDEPLDKLGLASLTAAMMNEATTNSSGEELSKRLGKLGSFVSFSADDESSSVQVRSLTRNLGATLDLVAEKLLSPSFDAADFERVKAQQMQSIGRSGKQARAMADTVYSQLLFGNNNSHAYPDSGTKETVSKLTIEDVKQFYRTYYSPKIAHIVVVSDLASAELRDKLAVFDSWRGSLPPGTVLNSYPNLYEPGEELKRKLYLVDKPGAAQAEIRIGYRSLPFDATGDYFRLGIMNYALGGTFNSRINLNLREDKGYAYAARSRFRGQKDYGYFTASAGVQSDVTAQALIEFDKEIEDFAASGPTAEELAFTKNSIRQRNALLYETPALKLRFLGEIQTHDLAEDFMNLQAEVLSDIGRGELKELAARYLRRRQMITVVVGDRSSLLPELKKLEYEIISMGNTESAGE